MKDQNGIYYHPDPNDIHTRVYVRQGDIEVEFRLWRNNMPEVWEKHGWMRWSVIEDAASLYKPNENKLSPLRLYDINVAKTLIKESLRG